MKKLNRIIALALVGVMTLVMLTGCCTGPETNAMGEKLIEEFFKAYNALQEDGNELENDEELKGYLDEVLLMIDPETDVFDIEAWQKEYLDKFSDGGMSFEIGTQKGPDGKYYATPVTEDNFDMTLNQYITIAGNLAGKVKAIAVSYQGDSDKIYAGIIVKF